MVTTTISPGLAVSAIYVYDNIGARLSRIVSTVCVRAQVGNIVANPRLGVHFAGQLVRIRGSVQRRQICNISQQSILDQIRVGQSRVYNLHLN